MFVICCMISNSIFLQHAFHWPLHLQFVFFPSSQVMLDHLSIFNTPLLVQEPDQTLYNQNVSLLLCCERLLYSTSMCFMLDMKRLNRPSSLFYWGMYFSKRTVILQRIILHADLPKKPFTKTQSYTLTELNNENLKCSLAVAPYDKFCMNAPGKVTMNQKVVIRD